jgi:hypothetical protein
MVDWIAMDVAPPQQTVLGGIALRCLSPVFLNRMGSSGMSGRKERKRKKRKSTFPASKCLTQCPAVMHYKKLI